MFGFKGLILATAIAALAPVAALAAPVYDTAVAAAYYSGVNATRTTGGGGLGQIGAGAATLQWTITPIVGGFRYSYTLTTTAKNRISHFILDLSDDCTQAGYDDGHGGYSDGHGGYNKSHSGYDNSHSGYDDGHGGSSGDSCFSNLHIVSPDKSDKTEFALYGTSSSNPGIPGTIRGVKIDGTDDSNDDGIYSFWFDSNRVPVWGDFYAKGGDPVKNPDKAFAVWDVGLGNHSSASIWDFIARPDTRTVEAPEPATLALFGVGLLGVGAFRRRKPN